MGTDGDNIRYWDAIAYQRCRNGNRELSVMPRLRVNSGPMMGASAAARRARPRHRSVRLFVWCGIASSWPSSENQPEPPTMAAVPTKEAMWISRACIYHALRHSIKLQRNFRLSLTSQGCRRRFSKPLQLSSATGRSRRDPSTPRRPRASPSRRAPGQVFRGDRPRIWRRGLES